MATATTSPAGLMVTFTYDGLATAPTNAGSYAVVGTISDSNYQGSALDTMIIHLSTYTVSGVVTVGVSPLAGVTMNGLPGNPVTDGDGKYAATVDEGFEGTVVPTKEGYTFAPENRDYANVNADQTNQDFVATLTPITVTLAPLITSKNSGDSFTLTATVTGGVGTIHYVWMKDGSNAPYATDNNQYSVASVTKGDAGIYYVYASDDNQTVFSNASTLRVGAGVPALGLAGLGALFGLIIIARARK
jgi:hypothetical protein